MPGPTPIVGDVLQTRMEMFQTNQIALNVLHYKVVSVVGGGLSLLEMCNAFAVVVGGTYRSLMPITAFFESTSFQNITFPMSVANKISSHAAGTAIGNSVPKQVSALIDYRTLLAGKAQRGRSYIGFISDTFITAGGELSGAGFAILVNLAGLLGPDVSLTFGGRTTNLKLQIRHPDIPGPPPVIQSTDVVTSTAQALLATQRRRGDYGRSNLP